MAIYDTHASRSRSRVDVSDFFAVVLILTLLGIIALDAYAFSTLKF